jgi:hypothetical protein
VMGTGTQPGLRVPSIRRLVSHRRLPSRAAAEYDSTPEVAGTPAPGSALMSSFDLRPSLDRWLRRGRLASRA